MTEEWRPVEGFESEYEVSSLGRVRTLARTWKDTIGRTYRSTPKVLEQSAHVPRPGRRPMLRVSLRDPARANASRPHAVHTLVARAFLGEPPAGPWAVRFVNGDTADCRAVNLEYETRASGAAYWG